MGAPPASASDFLGGAIGCLLVYAGARTESLIAFLAGMSLAGAGVGVVNLARAAAADMYPPERRARGISYVLAGAGVGAIIGPVAFTPLFARAGGDLEVLGPPWLVATGVMLAGAALTYAIRKDSLVIASAAQPGSAHARKLGAVVRIPLVRVAIVAAVFAQIVMTSMMSMVSLVLHDHGHGWPSVSISLSAHFLGMFGLVLVIGRLIDRLGRTLAALIGLVILGAGTLALIAEIRLLWIAPAMFAIGIGWNVSYVAATAMLADATSPTERAGLLGFVDFLALGGAAIGTVLAGIVLDRVSLGALVGIGTGLSLLPVLALGARGRRRAALGTDAVRS